jgi:L-threonylcarbamoyladenylate synthase
MRKKNTIIFNNILSDSRGLKKAAGILKKGGTIVFPTETVYGLGANAYNEEAVKNIFAAKGRPADNPLIVHLFNPADLSQVADNISPAAYTLFAEFSPGPLTLVLNKNTRVPGIVTAGLETVAVRIPSHPIARALLEECSFPIAAPSANRSGRPSPTTFEMALSEMEGRVDAVINGGDCEIGLESTVINLEEKKLHILRPGAITEDMLKKALASYPGIEVISSEAHLKKPLSPGTKYSHYKPSAEVYIMEQINSAKIMSFFPGKKIGLIMISGSMVSSLDMNVICFKNIHEYARGLYKSFAELDGKGMDIIITQAVEDKGLGKAVMNRLLKASGGKFIK